METELIHFNRELYVFEVLDLAELKSTICDVCDLVRTCRIGALIEGSTSICKKLNKLGSVNSVRPNSTIKRLSLFRIIKYEYKR